MQFHDPIYRKTEWTHRSEGYDDFHVYRLVEINSNLLEFSSSKKDYRNLILGLLVGLIVLIILFFSHLNNSGEIYLMGIISISIPTTFIFWVAGWYNNAVMVFDKKKGVFWKALWRGEERPNDLSCRKKNLKHFVPLDEIHALQLITVTCAEFSDNYQLNLILKDSERIKIIETDKSNVVRQDAIILAKFLNIPVWDAI